MRRRFAHHLLIGMSAAYRIMLRAYPREFRRRYRNEMMQVFIDHGRRTAESRGILGLLGMALHVGLDFSMSAAQERFTAMKNAQRQSAVRWTIIGAVIACCTMIGVSIARYRPFLMMDQSGIEAAEPIVALIVYGIVAAGITSKRNVWRQSLLTVPLRIGVGTGIVQAAHILLENFTDFGAHWNGIVALSVMATSFLLWGVAGYFAARDTKFLFAGPIGGAWSGMVSGMICVTCGLALEMFVHPPSDSYVATWAEFKRSGWTDVHAFTIANTLESGFQHLLLSPIVGALFGGVAGLFSRRLPRHDSTVSV